MRFRGLRFRVLGASFSRFWGLRFRSRVLRFRVLGASFSSFGCFVFEFWVLRFRDLGASFSRFGCFVLRSSFSSASFSKLPVTRGDTTVFAYYWFSHDFTKIQTKKL